MKNGGDGELQQAAVAAKSGAERDRGAFNHSATLVTVLAVVQDRDVCACACSSEFTGGFLGLDIDRSRHLHSTTGSKFINIANNRLH